MKKHVPIKFKTVKAKYHALSVFLKQSTFILGLCLFFNAQSFGQTTVIVGSQATVTFPYQAAAYTWTPPSGVTSINIEAWGGGGGGGGSTGSTGRAGGGGGGGAYVKHSNVTVSNTAYSITIGAGGTTTGTSSNGTAALGGSNTSATFGGTTITAVGGNPGGQGNSSTPSGAGAVAVTTGNSTGASISFYGGAGASGIQNSRSGGGGGAAGENSNGGIASSSAVDGGSYGGSNTAPYGIGAPGNNTTNGTSGTLPGGGGSGGYTAASTGRTGGIGGAGQLVITYTVTTPTLSLSSSTLAGFTTSTDAASATQTINVSGANLSSNITISSALSNFEISTNSSSGFGSSVTIPFGSGSVTATALYIRIKSGSTIIGPLSESITFKSTGATDQILTCSGSVVTNYYYKGTGSLASLSNWGNVSDGSGTNPPDFGPTTSYQAFNIINTTSVSTDAPWTVAGTGSKIILGNSTKSAVQLTIASAFAITGIVDITAASSGNNELILGSTTTPNLGTLDVSANLTYANGASGVSLNGALCSTIKISNNTSVTFTNSPNCKFLIVDAGSSISASTTSNVITLSTGGNAIINGSLITTRSFGAFTTDATSVSKGTIFSADPAATITLGASSTVNYNRTSAQSIAALNYANLTIGASTPIITPGILTGATTVNGNFSILGGSTLNTAGFPLTVSTPLTLSENATLTLGAGSHNVTFAASNAAAWTAGKTLTITGWTGTAGATGTAGKIFIGSSASGLTAQQISQIAFTGFANGAVLLSTGELVPSTGVLPIQLLSFTGKKENNAVQLSWSTASEKNNLRFDILRSGSDKVFQKIGEVNGNGHTNTTLYYNFSDRNPITGINYYQLNQVDFDGKTQEFGPISVTADITSGSLAIYAYSDRAELIVSLNSSIAKPIEISVYDLSGRNIIQQRVSLEAGFNQFSLSASSLIKGIHILKISSNEGVIVKKFSY